MKKINLFTLLLVFCCIVMVFAACDNSAEHKKIAEAYAELYDSCNSEVELKCYGEFGGTHVVLFNGIYAQENSSETVDDVTFYYSCITGLHAYNKGSFYTLQEAFDNGLLTHADLVTVRDNHKSEFEWLYTSPNHAHAAIAFEYGRVNADVCSVDKQNISFSCYGEYAGTHIVLFDGMFDSALTSETVDGVTFNHTCIRHFYAYNKGKLCTLQEAFDNGLITHKDLLDLKSNFERDIKSTHNYHVLTIAC